MQPRAVGMEYGLYFTLTRSQFCIRLYHRGLSNWERRCLLTPSQRVFPHFRL
jgi:hypothetical protein